MKVVKLSGAQTNSLEAMGVDISADVLIPFGRGPGKFFHCDYCYHQRYEIKKDGCQKVCGNPVVEHGIRSCFHLVHNGENYELLPE